MRLTYKTGTATLIQFIFLSFLNLGNGANSIIANCRHHNDCVVNVLTSVVFYILVVIWFGSLWVLGYIAQDRRSKRLAQLLICAEALVALVALFNAKHHTDALGLFTSAVDLVLALWIIILAFRLMRAGNSRVVSRQRPRKPPTSSAI